MKRLILFITLVCFVFNINSQSIPILDAQRIQQIEQELQAESLVFDNFRIIDGQPNRIYFDMSDSATGIFSTGITISGAFSITGMTLTLGDSYFTIDNAFTFWDNNVIKYEGGSDVESTGGNALMEFTMEYIHNQTPPPTEGLQETYFVDNTKIFGNDGLTEANAFSTLQQAIDSIPIGTGGILIWVKATGTIYSEGALNDGFNGISTSPNVIKGYKTVPGDLDGNKPIDIYTVNIGSLHAGGAGYASLDAAEMPLFDGGGRDGGLRFYSMASESYYRWENIQIQNYMQGFYCNQNGAGYYQFKNMILKDFGDLNANLGSAFNIVGNNLDDTTNFRFEDILIMNPTISGIVCNSHFSLIKNVQVYCEDSNILDFGDPNPTTDYYLTLGLSDGVITNSLAYKDTKDGAGHSGHGLNVRETINIMERNLIVDSESVGILGSYELRNQGCAFNVVKRIIAHADIPNARITEYGTGGVKFHTGANNNIFELFIIRDVQHGIMQVWNTESNTAQINNNITRNGIIYNTARNVFWSDTHTDANTQANDNKFLNIVIDNSVFFSKADNAGILTMTGNEWINCSFNNIPTQENTDANNEALTGHTFDNNHSWDCDPWLPNLTPLTGTANISADPLFTNQGANIYTLQDTSPLIDAGQTLTDVKSDFNNVPRPQGYSYDIGAYEFIQETTTFDTDYQALLDYATTQTYVLPSSAQQIVQNQVVLDLKTEGAWIEYDVIYVPANDGSRQFGTLNWKDPTVFQLIENGTITWTSNIGFKTDGTTGYLNTTWDAQTNGVKYTFNDARAEIYIITQQPLTVSGNLYNLFGAEKFSGDSNLRIRVDDTSNARLTVEINAVGSDFLNGAATDHTGLLTAIMKDDATNEQRLYKGTTLTVDAIETAQTFDHANDIYIGALNDNGVVIRFSSAEWGWFSLGSSMTAKQSALNTIISNYINGL